MRQVLSICVRHRWVWLTLVTGALATLFFGRRSSPIELGLSVGLATALASLVVIDVDRYRLPDVLTIPLILVGVLLVPPSEGGDAVARLVSAVAGYGVFFAVGEGYRRLRGRVGLGLGDAKLFAAAGAWCTWSGLPLVLAIGSAAALLTLCLMALRGRTVSGTTQIAFGPFLALGFWLVWVFGPLL